MSTQSGLQSEVPNIKKLPALRKPLDEVLVHHHESDAGFIRRRLGDGGLGPEHKVVWNFYEPRNRWEAVCEHTDVVFFAAAVPEDLLFRAGRTLKNG